MSQWEVKEGDRVRCSRGPNKTTVGTVMHGCPDGMNHSCNVKWDNGEWSLVVCKNDNFIVIDQSDKGYYER